MKITQVHVYQRDLPVAGMTYRMSHSELAAMDSTIVELVTDSGLRGHGETCPVGPVYAPEHALGARAALAQLAPAILGADPLLIGLVRGRLDGALAGHSYAKAAIDIALWDLAGQHLGLRVCDLLGGAVRESVPSYYAIGPMAPDETARVARDKVAQGFPRLQMKVGGRPVEEDVEAIRKVAEVLPRGVRLAADANRGWNARDLIFASNQCQDINVVMEQPLDSLDEIAAVRPLVHHPIYIDESTYDLGAVIRCIGAGLADGFGLKVTRLGGLTPMRTVRDMCAARSLPHTCDDSWGGDIIAAACTAIGATVDPALSEGVWIADPYIAEHYDPVNGPRIEDGRIRVPQGPGLGLTIEPGRFGAPVASFG